MGEFGKRGAMPPPQQGAEEGMSVTDRFILFPKLPLYLTLGMMAGVAVTLVSGTFSHGMPSLLNVIGMIIPLAFLAVMLFLSFKGLQKRHAAERATQKQLAKYPQLWFWGITGGALAYGLSNAVSITDLWNGLTGTFDTFSSTAAGGEHNMGVNHFAGMVQWMGGGYVLAYVVSLVLDRMKERENAR